MGNESSLGITPASGYTTQLALVYNSVFPSPANVTPLGQLSQDSTKLTVLSQLEPNIPKDYYKFDFTSGSNLKLSFNSTTSLSDATQDNPAGTSTDGVSAGLRFQIFDIAGNIVADSGGTPAQQAAYSSLTSSSGLAASNGTYYVKVSPAPLATLTSQTSYDFELYSGTTYNTNLTYTAQSQAYDPNLFNPAYTTVTPASNLTTYTNAATLSGTQASALNIGTLDINQSELYANSQINSANQASYYTFNFHSGTALKFNLYNTTSASVQQGLRVQLFDSGGNIVADNVGTQAQQDAYKKFDSGEGLNAANGQYTVKISYAPGSYTTSAQQYNFQIYSGSTYNTLYQTTANLPTSTSTDGHYGKNVGVFADLNAKLYTHQEYHTVGETAQSGPTIGWLSANKAAANIVSQLTKVDNVDYYNFTLQQGNNLKLSFNNQTDANTRVQLLDPTGSYVIADNYGTSQQKQAFANLTSSAGLVAKPQNYAVKVTNAPGTTITGTQTYDFQLYSGTSYTSLYKFTASAQTYQNAVLSGNTSVVGFNPNSLTASLLNYGSSSPGVPYSPIPPSIFDALSSGGSAYTPPRG